ncbi:hypothetical protein F4778DRAFT_372141 [Xylariomycetidae sp. FL2044]|nr:hypothetical protein F4778DRAFT_372141 [Xylariomycetidae sp. FL2044]
MDNDSEKTMVDDTDESMVDDGREMKAMDDPEKQMEVRLDRSYAGAVCAGFIHLHAALSHHTAISERDWHWFLAKACGEVASRLREWEANAPPKEITGRAFTAWLLLREAWIKARELFKLPTLEDHSLPPFFPPPIKGFRNKPLPSDALRYMFRYSGGIRHWPFEHPDGLPGMLIFWVEYGEIWSQEIERSLDAPPPYLNLQFGDGKKKEST